MDRDEEEDIEDQDEDDDVEGVAPGVKLLEEEAIGEVEIPLVDSLVEVDSSSSSSMLDVQMEV